MIINEPAWPPGALQTYTGKWFVLSDPKPELVDIRDIAHSLSQLCRFNGQTKCFYSVAQHSVRVQDCLEHAVRGVQLAALMHDAAEAYVGDMARPVKYLAGLDWFRRYEVKIWGAIRQRYAIPWTETVQEAVKRADDMMVALERQQFMPENGQEAEANMGMFCHPWDHDTAEIAFLRRFRQLRNDNPAITCELLT